MNVHFTYKLDKSPAVDQLLDVLLKKLSTRLQIFNPDMISLRGLFDVAPKAGFAVSLNLRLPSGQMTSHVAAPQMDTAIRQAFDDLFEQLTKHKEHLRSHYRYPRVRGTSRRPVSQIDFAKTLAVVHPEPISSLDVATFLNANLERLRRYVERELSFRRDLGQRRLDEISIEEVINEAVANALDESQKRPEKMALEAWLYRLSRSAMDRLANQLTEAGEAPSDEAHALEEATAAPTAACPSLDESDDEQRAFYNPDDLTAPGERLFHSASGSSPEDEASREELLRLAERALRGVSPAQREVFLLYTSEGFRLAEIASITGHTTAEVEADLIAARRHLRRLFAPVGVPRAGPHAPG